MNFYLIETTFTLKEAAAQVFKKLNSWAVETFKMLPNLVVAIIVLVIVWFLSFLVEKVVHRTTLRLSRNVHIANFFSRMARLAAIGLGVVLALNVLNLDRAVASLLAGAGILGVALGFASQDIAANFMAGVLLHFIHPFRMGDMIKSGEFLGYIEAIDMRSTKIRNQQGQIITIPNKAILGSPIVNFTTSGVRRVDLPWSLTQVEDLPKAEELAIKAVETLESPLRNLDRRVELFYEKVGDYTIDFELRFWTQPDQQTYLKARSEAIKAIKQIYEEHGIPMPSPVRALDFGIVGGTSLREELTGLLLPGIEKEAEEKKEAKEKEEKKEAEEEKCVHESS